MAVVIDRTNPLESRVRARDMLNIVGQDQKARETWTDVADMGENESAVLQTVTTFFVWTLTTVVDGDPICTVHRSKDLAYREAVSRLQYAESLNAIQLRVLDDALHTALANNNYHFLHKCMQNVAIRTSAIQLNQHQLIASQPNASQSNAESNRRSASSSEPISMTGKKDSRGVHDGYQCDTVVPMTPLDEERLITDLRAQQEAYVAYALYAWACLRPEERAGESCPPAESIARTWAERRRGLYGDAIVNQLTGSHSPKAQGGNVQEIWTVDEWRSRFTG